MDDMNQKENFMRLNMQTIDHRMTMLEEIAVQNSDTLGHIRSFMQQFDTRSRHVSSTSTRSSSRIRLDSEDSANDQMDLQQYEEHLAGSQSSEIAGPSRRRFDGNQNASEKSLTPEAHSTMKSLPSPILIHSQKAVKDDCLQKYTDFSKSPATKTSMPLTRRIERQTSLKHRRSLPKLTEQISETDQSSQGSNSPTTSTSSATNPLLERRHGNIPRLQIDANETTTVPKHRDSQESDNSKQNTPGLYSTAHMDTATSLTSTQPAQIELTNDGSNRAPSPLCIDIPTPEMGQVSFYPGTSEYMPAHTMPFTPILTSRSAEYTAITDDIDTSCMMTRSPPRSPTSAVPYNESPWEEQKMESPACISEKETLKQAEEMEHRRMEKVIKHRMRQISKDESDSISDITKLVINEMEIEDVHTDHEDEVSIHGSTEDLHEASSENTPEQAEAGPITFEATTASVEIRIRRASTLDEERL